MTDIKQEILKDFDEKFRITSDGELISKTLSPENDLKDFLSQAIDRVERETRNKVVDQAQLIVNEELTKLINGYSGKKQEIINLILKL